MNALNEHTTNGREGGKQLNVIVLMLLYGLAALVIGMTLTKGTLAKVGQWDMEVVMAASFGPLWVGAAIGWAVAFAAALGGEPTRWRPPVIAAALAFPAAILDPWAIVSLGLFNRVAIDVLKFEPSVAGTAKVLLFLLPMFLAFGFATMGVTVGYSLKERTDSGRPRFSFLRVIIGLAVLISVHQAVNLLVYSYLLPPRNL